MYKYLPYHVLQKVLKTDTAELMEIADRLTRLSDETTSGPLPNRIDLHIASEVLRFVAHNLKDAKP